MISVSHAKEKCKDDISKIENYEQAINDTTQTWVCHHRLELTLDGEFAHNSKDLIRMGMYYKRPYYELIFLTWKDHALLHNRTEYKREKTSKSLSGENNPMFGKSHTNETKDKIRKAQLGKKFEWKPRSVFGKEFYEHFGITAREDKELYRKEQKLYYKLGKCSWK